LFTLSKILLTLVVCKLLIDIRRNQFLSIA
jgi:hypothetical protein